MELFDCDGREERFMSVSMVGSSQLGGAGLGRKWLVRIP